METVTALIASTRILPMAVMNWYGMVGAGVEVQVTAP